MFGLLGKGISSDKVGAAARLFLTSAGATFDKPKRSLGIGHLAYSLTSDATRRTTSFVRGTIEGLKEESGISKKDLMTLFLTGINPVVGFLAHSTKAQLSGFDRVAYSIEENTETIGGKLDKIKESIEEGPIIRHLKKLGSFSDIIFGGIRLFTAGKDITNKATFGFRYSLTGSPMPGFSEVFLKSPLSLWQRIGIIGGGMFLGRFLPDFLKGPVFAPVVEKVITNIMKGDTRRELAKSLKEEGVFTTIGTFIKKNFEVASNELSKRGSFSDRFQFHAIKRVILDEDPVKIAKKSKAVLRIFSQEYRMLEFELARGIVNRFYKYLGVRFPILYVAIESIRHFGSSFIKVVLDTLKTSPAYGAIFKAFEKILKGVTDKVFDNKFVKSMREKLGKVLAPVGDKIKKVFDKIAPFFGKIREFLFGKKEDPVEGLLSKILGKLSETQGIFSTIWDKASSIFGLLKEYFYKFYKFGALPVINVTSTKIKESTSKLMGKSEDKNEKDNKEDKEKDDKDKDRDKDKDKERDKDKDKERDKGNKGNKKNDDEDKKRKNESMLIALLSFIGNLIGRGIGAAGSFLSGAAGSLIGLIPGKFKGAGKLLKSGKFLKGLGIVGAGLGGYSLFKKATSGEASENKVMGTLGDAAEGALTGAAIGSIVPGLGTKLGALIGGSVGLGIGIYRNFARPIIKDLSDEVRNFFGSMGKRSEKSFDNFDKEVGKMNEVFTKFDEKVVKEGEKGFKSFFNLGKSGLNPFTIMFGPFSSAFNIAKGIGGFVYDKSKEFLAKELGKENENESLGKLAGEYVSQKIVPTIGKVSSSVKEAFLNMAGLKSASQFKGQGEEYLKEVLNPKNNSKIPFFYGQYYGELSGVTTRDHAISESLKTMQKFQSQLKLDNDLMAMYLAKFDVESQFNPFLRTGITDQRGRQQTASGLGQLIDSTRLSLLQKAANNFGIDIKDCKGGTEAKIACITKKILDNKAKTGIENLIQLETYLAILHNIDVHDFVKRLPTPQDKWAFLRLYHAQPATAKKIFEAYLAGKSDAPLTSVLGTSAESMKNIQQLAINVPSKKHAPHSVTVGDVVNAFGGKIERFRRMAYIAQHLEKYSSSSQVTPSVTKVEEVEKANITKETKPQPQVTQTKETKNYTPSNKAPTNITPKTETKNYSSANVNSGNVFMNFYNFNYNVSDSSSAFGIDNFTLRK